MNFLFVCWTPMSKALYSHNSNKLYHIQSTIYCQNHLSSSQYQIGIILLMMAQTQKTGWYMRVHNIKLWRKMFPVHCPLPGAKKCLQHFRSWSCPFLQVKMKEKVLTLLVLLNKFTKASERSTTVGMIMLEASLSLHPDVFPPAPFGPCQSAQSTCH